MATFNLKQESIEAHPVAHLILDANSNWDALPDFVKQAYERKDLLFLRREISVEVPGKLTKKLAQWDDWIVNIQGLPVIVTNESFLLLFKIAS